MSYTVPSGEPSRFAAGDRVRWTRSLAEFPSSEWTLKYYFKIQNDPNDNSGPVVFTATNVGGLHDVDVAAAVSGALAPGRYFWTAHVERISAPTERYKVGEGFITIDANISGVTTPFDARTQARRILDALLTAYESRAGRPEQAYSISAAGRSFTYKTDAEMRAAIDYWRAEVAREDTANNLGRGRNIFVRFGTPY